MPVQWTAHIPQAMQRHGGSIKPQSEREADEAMNQLLRAMRRVEPPHQTSDRADER